MPELSSIKICKLSKEAQAKIDSKIEYRDKILHFLHNDNLFRIGNTNVSARTAVYLEKVGLLKEKKAKTGWRKLNFIDAIYFDLLVELRKFGMTAKKLIHLKEAFYKSDDAMDAMFLAAFYGYEITLIIFNDGGGYIFDPYTLADYSEKIRSSEARIILELNPYINKALSLLNIPTVKVSFTAKNIEKGGATDKQTPTYTPLSVVLCARSTGEYIMEPTEVLNIRKIARKVKKGDKNTKLQIAKELNEIAKIIIELHYQEKQGKTP